MARLSAFADEVSQDLKTQLLFLQKNNIQNIEIRFIDSKNICDYPLTAIREFKKMIDDFGIGFSALGSPIGKVRIDESFEPHMDKFKHVVAISDELGINFIRVFSYYPPDGNNIDGFEEAVLERMTRKINYLKGTDGNIQLVHENEANIFGHNAMNCALMARSLDPEYFGLVYDPANFVWGEKITDNMSSCWRELAPYVCHIHIKDWKLGDKETGVIPGEGDGQIPELFRQLKQTNYSGYVTMEPHLSHGGQFGGETEPELFVKAIQATKQLAEQAEFQLT